METNKYSMHQYQFNSVISDSSDIYVQLGKPKPRLSAAFRRNVRLMYTCEHQDSD